MNSLDAIDLQILNELQLDGRVSHAELAARVGLSASACHRRVRRLEAEGVIDGYVMIVNRRAIGRDVDVFVEVSLLSQSKESLKLFESEVGDCPELMSCHLVAGDADYLLHLAVKDQRDFERIFNRYLTRFTGVARLRSSFAIRTVHETTRHVL
ncbi:MAG: Lrp/AsnC family transcriptional regulator [bacterium]|nr:Lrp/AsnC family transcriptional regulator [bacterium]MXZ30068.1 Lrp/AsnC family transcriptional regulator [Acidimicrobiia bacterium]MDE0669771.1 Lrp/AsnC family transcriptional regulator [bacterium]MYB25549.1 Lrp/AsnC family transcriptional regulator [Acidimicrobiia bacterium]MYE66636.1 Lrp/AsnC family transcriptional regulator [Acidimicrobiia bacterium]